MVVSMLENSNTEKENCFGMMIITKTHAVKISLWLCIKYSCSCASASALHPLVVWELTHGIDSNILFVGSFCMAAGCTRSFDESWACIQI